MRKSFIPFCLLPIILFFLLHPLSAIALSWNLETILKTYMKDNYPWAEIEMQNLMVTGKLPDEPPVRIDVEKGLPGKTVFAMEFRDGLELTASANVKAFDWIVMSGRAFRKGYNFKKDDVYVRLMDVTRIPKGAIKSPEQVIGKTLTRSIISNTPLVDNMVSDVPVVKRGRRVILFVESPSFIITTAGELKENGYVGSQIKVKNLASKKVISGLLMDENTVKVEF